MIKSMTGFGKSQIDFDEKTVTIEIKSLNSKQLDLNTRIAGTYREKELETRNLLTQSLERGKVDFYLSVDYKEGETAYKLNKSLALNYYEQLKDLAASMSDDEQQNYLSILVRLPDVLKAEKEELNEEEWNKILEGIVDAIENLKEFRAREGLVLASDMEMRANSILDLLKNVDPFEEGRITTLREKLENQLKELNTGDSVDKNRFEQEMIYYLEKLDITEEKVRLKKHCEYFLETMQSDNSAGKKLGFISQEIGREINTLGAKANEVNIQKIVIQMKDELEKIKEQLSNIL